MKTIEVTDEMYDKLIELATNMTTQDPRCTAMPHLFQIETKKKVYDWNCNGDHKIWIDRDWDFMEIESYDVLVSYLKDREIEIPENFKEIFDDHYDIDDFIKTNCPNLEECTYTYENEYKNAFFTEKACKEHIEKYGYHYNQPVDYLNHAWRNPEMDLVSEFLCGLVGKQTHK